MEVDRVRRSIGWNLWRTEKEAWAASSFCGGLLRDCSSAWPPPKWPATWNLCCHVEWTLFLSSLKAAFAEVFWCPWNVAVCECGGECRGDQHRCSRSSFRTERRCTLRQQTNDSEGKGLSWPRLFVLLVPVLLIIFACRAFGWQERAHEHRLRSPSS